MDCICESCARKDCSDRQRIENNMQIVISCNFYLKYNPTNGDRLRAMSDEELASFLYGLIDLDSKIHYCKNKPECDDLLDTEDGIPVEMCTGCLCEWLRQPAEEG